MFIDQDEKTNASHSRLSSVCLVKMPKSRHGRLKLNPWQLHQYEQTDQESVDMYTSWCFGSGTFKLSVYVHLISLQSFLFLMNHCGGIVDYDSPTDAPLKTTVHVVIMFHPLCLFKCPWIWDWSKWIYYRALKSHTVSVRHTHFNKFTCPHTTHGISHACLHSKLESPDLLSITDWLIWLSHELQTMSCSWSSQA